MESNQVNINKKQTNCTDIIMSEDYFDLIVEYKGNIETVLENYNAECYQIINEQFMVIHISVSTLESCDTLFKTISLLDVPSVFGPYGKGSLERSGILVFHERPGVTLTGKGVIMGFIDSGIDYTNSVFVYEDNSSKIISIWDQTIQGKPPEDFNYGTEFTNDDINKALSTDDPYKIVPEKDGSGHGTFLAGVGAGREDKNADFIGAAPGAQIIMVKLKPAKRCLKQAYFINGDAIVYQSNDIMFAIQYLSKKAKELDKPLVITIGLGSDQGAHNGSSLLESVIAKTIEEGNIIIIAAGNEGNTGHHYRGQFSMSDTYQDVEVNIATNENGLYIHLWIHAPDIMSISIRTPTGKYIRKIPVALEKVEEYELIVEQTKIMVRYQYLVREESVIIIFIKSPVPGLWTIRVHGDVIIDGRYDIYLPRKGWVEEDTRFLRPDPDTTVTIPSTGVAPITVGAYNHEKGNLYAGSGRGLTRNYKLKPNLVAPGVNVHGPITDNDYGTMTGTSVATAITSGAVALLLEWGIVLGNYEDMNNQIAKKWLQRGAIRKDGLEYPNSKWGYGELNLLNSFEILKKIQ